MSESINALHLPPRAWNALTRYGIKTIDDLCALSAERVLEFINIGTGTLKTIEDALAAHGESLAESDATKEYRQRLAWYRTAWADWNQDAKPSDTPDTAEALDELRRDLEKWPHHADVD
jgi:hypothetical protein